MHHKKINHIDVKKNISVSKLVKEMQGAAFGGRRLGEATDILEGSLRDKENVMFLGISGALVPAGMRQILRDMIADGWANVVVTTGANIVHDIMEAYGHSHCSGTERADDVKLREQKIDRIYDVFLPNEAYEDLERKLHKIFSDLPKKRMGVREFLFELGKKIPDKNSILRTAADKNIPVFCPGIADSAIGFHAWSYMLENELNVDTFLDMNEMMDLTWGAKKTSIFILGGGVPKDFIMQAMQFSPKQHSSAVQITMDRPEHGGLSGAELREGISWGKLSKNSKYCTVVADVTIVLPFIVGALKERGL